MRTITTNDGRKDSGQHPGEWCAVHDGTTLLALGGPGSTTGSGPARTMLVGTAAEVAAAIAGLQVPEHLAARVAALL